MSYIILTQEQAQEYNGHRNGVNVFNAAKLADSDMWAVHINAINEFPELPLSGLDVLDEVEFEEALPELPWAYPSYPCPKPACTQAMR